jgi:hypothetical protein
MASVAFVSYCPNRRVFAPNPTLAHRTRKAGAPPGTGLSEKVKVKIKFKIKIKVSGQECPPYLGISSATVS